jgi:hypothetical protein
LASALRAPGKAFALRRRQEGYDEPQLVETLMNQFLLQPAATITAALITNPAPGVSRTRIEDMGALFIAVYNELAKAAAADAERAKPATA